MAKLDLSKQGLQTFFLNHAEKLVIGLCTVGLGALAWAGWNTPAFTDDTPGGLSAKATQQAEAYLNRPDAWESIEAFRKLPSDPRTEVSRKTELDAALFTMDSLVGPLVKTADLRKDPALVQLQQPAVHAFTAPVLLVPGVGISRLGELPLASAGAAPAGNGGGGRGGGDSGRGGGGATGSGAPGVGGTGGSGGDAGDGAGDGGRGGGAGGQNAGDGGGRMIPGDRATNLHRQEFVGVRGFTSGGRGEAFLRDICQVTATIDAAELSRIYQENFVNARAWYPDRDKPAFYRVQVEIVMDGQTAATDISDRVLVQIPKQYGIAEPSAEVISPENFDGKAAPPLPPITGFDYRQLMAFAGQPLRSLKPDDLFADAKVVEEKPVGVFDVATGEPAETEDEGTPLNWLFGNETAGYESKKLEKKQIVVRILDLDPPVSGSFKYRLRVWLEDPNNTRDELVAGAKYFTSHYMPPQAAGGQIGGGGGALGGLAGGGGASDGGDRGAGQGGQQGDDPDEDDEPKIEYQPVVESDLDPAVRTRLRDQQAKRKKMLEDAASAPAGANPSPARDVWQTYCRPTEWVETGSISINPVANRGQVALGGVRETKPARINNLEIAKDEPVAQLLGASWSTTLGAWVPGYRPEGFRRGEALNYSVDVAHILNLVDLAVYRLKKDESEDEELNLELRVKTDHVVIDVLGGREIPVKSPMPQEFAGQKETRPWTMPGEVLVMDSAGKLVLHNEFDDLQNYRNGLFLEDETGSYGKVRAAPAAETPGAGR